MNILVWGLGYVGTVTAACLGNLGHNVVGIDSDASKVTMIQSGRSPIEEPGLGDLIAALSQSGTLRASVDGSAFVDWADTSLICVGTPSSEDGSLRTDAVERVAAQIAEAIRVSKHHTVIVRSTMPPGSTRGLILPIFEEYTGESAGRGFGLVINPEFLRETTAISDFASPPYTILGVTDHVSARIAAELYKGIEAPLHYVTWEEAELLKMACNTFHALKISFANEIGRISRPLGINPGNVMDLLCADTKLNISPLYLRPGFAFGGSCLPKDVRAINATARQYHVQAPLLGSLLPSNEAQIYESYEIIQATKPSQVTVLGLGFKANSNDMRESPVFKLIHLLRNSGIGVRVYDPDIRLGDLSDTSQTYLLEHLPGADTIVCDTLANAIDGSDCVVITQQRQKFQEVITELGETHRHIRIVNLT